MNPAQHLNPISRRDFLKLAGLGVLGAIFPPLSELRSPLASFQGRVIYGSIKVYDTPSPNGHEVRVHWRDTILPITGVTIGTDEPAYNRVWYRLGDESYAHSGGIQPVNTRLNAPDDNIPHKGRLAEVTVPFTDAHWGPGKSYPVAYRFYYETTHWVTRLVQDEGGDPWYRVIDDKWDWDYYVPAEHIRLVSYDELKPISPQVPLHAKRLEVRTGDQIVAAYEMDRLVFAARAATGAEFSNGKFYTPAGRHLTFHKRPSRHMAAGNLAANGFDLPGVPWVCYFTKSGIAFHGTYWHNDYGRPRSHGCINLTPQAAKWIYRWTLPIVPPNTQRVYEKFGTTVDVI